MELEPASLLFLAFSLPIAIVDLRRLRIPDALSLGGLVFALALTTLLSPAALPGRLAASAVACGAFFLLRRATGNKLGMGDVKYSAFMGAVLGLEGWFMAVLLASLMGLLVVMPLLAARRLKPEDRVPFAPFLAAGGTVWFVGGAGLFRALGTGGLS